MEIVRKINSNQGAIYVYDNGTCLKEYKDFKETTYSVFDEMPARITPEIVNYFNSINNRHMCKIIDYEIQNGEITSYLMPYYIEENESILNFSPEYISINFKELYDLMLKLTYDHVRIVDLNPDNLLLTQDGIILIDYDKYRYERELDTNILLEINKNALLYALQKKIEKSLSIMHKQADKNQIINFIYKNVYETESKKSLK